MLRSTFHGYCALEASGSFGAPRDVQASWRKAIEALHVTLSNWPRERHEPAQAVTCPSR